MRKKLEIDFNTEYNSNTSGKFIIIKDLGLKEFSSAKTTYKKRMIIIKFIQTGTEKEVSLGDAIRGKVTDPYYPSVFGVGYWGNTTKGSVDKREYDLWYTMLYRCYCPDCPAYKTYGGIGIKVCERWHSLENFLYDVVALENYHNWYNDTNNNWQLDKDELQMHKPKSERIYSPETCKFILPSYNSRLSTYTKRNESPNSFSSQYIGLYKTKYNTYQVTINIDKKKYFLGTYDDEIAAATVYNYVAARCIHDAKLNSLPAPYMDIKEALNHNSGRKPIIFPPNINNEILADNLQPHAKFTSQYTGVYKKDDGTYPAMYFDQNASRFISIATFNNEIAAANAHNWYEMFYGNNKAINNVPYMTPSEWLQYKSRYHKLKPVQMCTLVKINMCHII